VKIGDRVSLLCGDITTTNFKNGTHIYAGSLIFPDALMVSYPQQLCLLLVWAVCQFLNAQVEIATQLLDPASRAVTFSTLQKFPEEVEQQYIRRLKLWKTTDVAVSWQELAPLYTYKIRARARH
jgi:hypothetical protein